MSLRESGPRTAGGATQSNIRRPVFIACVSLAVIGSLVALVTPAVMRVREAAVQTTSI